MLRTWNARRKQWNWTPAGIDYYRHNRQRFIVNIPCLGYIASTMARAPPGGPVGGAGANENVLLRSTFFGQHQSSAVIPITSDTLEAQEMRLFPGAEQIQDLQLIHSGMNPEQVREELKDVVFAVLGGATTVATVDGPRQRIAVESVIIWVWDTTRELTFDEQIVDVAPGAAPRVEILLDRP